MPLPETQVWHGFANKNVDGKLHPIVPLRLLDTRVGATVGCILPNAIIGAATLRTYQVVSGCTKIPGEAVAIAGGLTSVNNTAGGYFTVWPANGVQPFVSHCNYNLTIPVSRATFISALSPDGKIKVYSSADTDLVIDIFAYFI